MTPPTERHDRRGGKAYIGAMADLTISLPEGLKSWIDRRVAEGGFGSSSDYLHDLVRRDQAEEAARARLLAAIDEGLASPVVATTIDEIIARGRARNGVA